MGEELTQVLARAVTWHAEHRVLLNGNRTVVLDLRGLDSYFRRMWTGALLR